MTGDSNPRNENIPREEDADAAKLQAERSTVLDRIIQLFGGRSRPDDYWPHNRRDPIPLCRLRR